MKTIKILSLTLFLSIFCAGMLFAQQPDQKRQRTNATPEERAAKRMERMKETLNLTPEQVTKLQATQAQFAKEREQVRKEHQQNMKAKREAYDAQLKTILTPEQYQKYQDQRKNMRKGEGQRGKWNKEGRMQARGNKDGKKCPAKSQQEKK